MTSVAACTIAANNYLALAEVFARTYLEHHPGARLFLCIADTPDPRVRYEDLPFTVVFAEDLGIPRFRSMAFRYNLLELNTAVKPFFLKHLRDTEGIDRAFYFDPDIRIYQHLEAAERALSDHQVVLTPHITEPLDNDHTPSEIRIRSCGVYNLGFLGIALDDGTSSFLDWWADRVHAHCYSDLPAGLFVDQSWMEFAPTFLDRVAILRDPGLNVAYWNLPHRKLHRTGSDWSIDDRPLGFFHFSGMRLDDLEEISRYQDRLTLADRPEIRPLFEGYRDEVLAAGHARYQEIEYGYGRFSDGAKIGPATRKGLLEEDPEGSRWSDPFDASDPQGYRSWLDGAQLHPGGRLPRAALLLWRLRPDVQAAFPEPEGRDIARFVEWLFTRPPEELLGLAPEHFGGIALQVPGVAGPHQPVSEEPAQQTEAAAETAVAPAPTLGVNVIGYLRAESGTGEHTRLLVEALDAARIPSVLVPVTTTLSRQEVAVEGSRIGAPRYDVNIVGVNADELPRVIADLGQEIFRDRYTIGLWAWELEQLPDCMAASASLLDEIWANSSFSARAIARRVMVPVQPFPLPIATPAPPPRTRSALGLPAGFVFLFCFDFDSVIERKNPLGAIAAFARAFPAPCGCHLVVKCINEDRHPEQLGRLLEAAEIHPDVHVMTGYLERGDQWALIAASDCYVSLHRSEGFGLTLGEAMALGRPVIATGYSGNLDFMTPHNSFLVPWNRTLVGPGAGPYPPDAVWAEPDLEAAAEAMRRVAFEPEEAARRAARALRDIAELHSPAVRAQFLRERLAVVAGRLGTHASDPHGGSMTSRSSDPDHETTLERRQRLLADLEHAESLLLQGPDMHLPSPLGGVAVLLRRLTSRLTRHRALHQREVDECLLRCLRGLAETSGAPRPHAPAAVPPQLADDTESPDHGETLRRDLETLSINASRHMASLQEGYDDLYRYVEQLLKSSGAAAESIEKLADLIRDLQAEHTMLAGAPPEDSGGSQP